jgi:hypothetical protein
MEMRKFTVTYRAFSESDATSTRDIPGIDEKDALNIFRSIYPRWFVVSVEEKK